MKNSNLPLIGVPRIYGAISDPHCPMYNNYRRTITLAGGLFKELNATTNSAVIKEQIRSCDGFVFMGGRDFSAEFSRCRNLPKERNFLDPEMEKYYRAIGKEVMFNTNKPVLGTCLGCQLINLLLGGSLYDDMVQDFPHGLWHKKPLDPKVPENYHALSIVPESQLAKILQCTAATVNSSHHQAVKELGENLVLEASAPDGVPEAISLADDSRFVLGVQWHPERLCAKLDSPEELELDSVYPAELRKQQLRLFEELCRQAAK